jgi:hypothetical protein
VSGFRFAVLSFEREPRWVAAELVTERVAA